MDVFDSCLNLSPSQTTPTTNTDFLDASFDLPETQMKEGHKDGYKDGLISGKQDAYQVGLKHGFECGEEVGFYRGLVEIWTGIIRIKPDFFSPRVRKSVEQLNELILKYPLLDPEDEIKDDVIADMRLKFKAVCATLGVKLEYKGYPKMNHEQDY